ncbi:MAG: TIGR02206 family membrane protein [Solirubrobacteraceae bacterium]
MRQFSPPHLAALAVLAAGVAASVWTARRHPGPATDRLAGALAVAIFAAWAGEYAADVVRGVWTAEYDLPFQLTDAVSLAAIVALLTRRAMAVELVYFWSLTASLQATLTPDLGRSFPSVYYFTYFVYHVGAVMAGCMLVFGCRIRPRPRAAWRVWGLTLGFAAVSGIADLISGGNYMYLHFKPQHNSLLAVMGPWPWYIASGAALGLTMMLGLQWIADRALGRDQRGGPGATAHPIPARRAAV